MISQNNEALYEQLEEKYVETEREDGTDLTEEEATEIVEMLENKGVDSQEVENIVIENGPGNSYTVTVEGADLSYLGVEDSTLTFDPDGEYCVTHGNKDTDVPPEGRTKNEDEDVYGIR